MGSAILVAAAGWSIGIGLGDLLDVPGLLVVLASAAAGCAALLAPPGLARLLAIALLAVLLGHGRGALAGEVPDSGLLQPFAGEIVARGRVLDAPIPRGSRVEAVVELDTLVDPRSRAAVATFEEDRPRILLRALAVPASFGDRIEVRGRLARPRSRPGWPLAEILARRGITWVLDAGVARVVEPGGDNLLRWLTAARLHFEGNARAVLPEPHASLVAGMVFGARSGLPPDLRADLTATGTSHLTAVSGANVALVAGALTIIATRLVGRAPASLIAIAGVWLYTLLVGAPPSALRAATMASVALIASGLGRQPDAIVGLLLAAAVLLGWDPGLAHDVGFQLSVAATAGLILLSPSIERPLFWVPRHLRGWIAIAVAAQLATLPIVLVTFQRLSLISLPANVLAAPLVVPIMSIGVALAAFGSLPFVDVLLGWAAWVATSLLLLVIHTCAAIPGAQVALGQPPAWLMFFWYGVLAGWVAAGSADVRALGIRRVLVGGGSLVGGSVLALGVLAGWTDVAPRGSVQVGLLDLEPSAALLRGPDGQTVLLLTSEPGPGLVAGVASQLDAWDSRVDTVVSPNGVRKGVSLLAVGSSADDWSAQEDGDVDGSIGTDADRPNAMAAPEPGATFDVAGVTVLVVDVRLAGDRPALDLAVLVGDLAIFLPGPGQPSPHWPSVAPDASTVARLPSSAVAWARSLPARHWLLLVGGPATARARGEPGLPFLTHRDHGLVDLEILDRAILARTERCEAGRNCVLEIPAPMYRTLLTADEGR